LKTLSVSKVVRNGPGGRITLAKEVLDAMALGIGDHVQLIEFQGRVFIQKVAPAEA
jgi:bifunctional DNA-binding transcriptional regulator/antitoxin component of YhaV-PrlF toxin-antitoxin module